jgi:hypothetical protein
MDADRRQLLVGFGVGLLLIFSGVVPHPVFGSPYETSDPAPYLHEAVPEDHNRFESLVDLYNFTPESATSVETLSPTGQQVVDRTISSEPDAEGWLRYELPVCRDSMLVCDSVREPPAEFEYDEGPPQQVFTIIEADGNRYLFQTGVPTGTGLTDGLGDQPESTYIWIFGLLPFGVIVIAVQAIGQQTGQRRLPAVLTAGGIGLLVVGFAVPYLTVAGVISYDALSRPLLFGVVGVTLLAVGGLVWQTVQYAGSAGR